MMSPSLADLDAFVAVARARGFRGAAAARGASASGLSEAVRRLEAALGVRLLNRTTRIVTPRVDQGSGDERAGIDVIEQPSAYKRPSLFLLRRSNWLILLPKYPQTWRRLCQKQRQGRYIL